MKRFVWLASYPKSGNTWFRIFLENLLLDSEHPADINRLRHGFFGAILREVLEDACGIDLTLLTPVEIERLRREFYTTLANESDKTHYAKVHDSYGYTVDHQPIFPPEITHAAVYLIRNPLDVCISFSFHNGHSDFDHTIDEMANPNFGFCYDTKRPIRQLPQRLQSWISHVKSWINAGGFPVLALRYEDMQREPLRSFTQAAKFLGLNSDTASIERALRHSSFAELQHQEQAQCFRERPPHTSVFFRSGKIDSWREYLSSQQVSQIISDHTEVMQHFGYLNAQGQIV